jgi:DNA segregation ATPase FtsK/SpoIIIE, S-DNA-T family
MKKNKKHLQKKINFQLPRIVQGTLLLAFSLLLTLSLLSYHDGDATKNWLGLVGHVMGWCSNYLFGLSSLLIPLFFGWVGWQMTAKKTIYRPRLKLLYFSLALVSLAILFAQTAHYSPRLSSIFEQWIHSDYYPHKASYDPEKYRHYLGGVPLHHLYADTTFNLKSILGGIGTFLIFFFLFFAAGMLLTEIPFSYFSEKAKQLYRWIIRPRRPRYTRKPAPVATPVKKAADPILYREDPLKKETRINFPEPAQTIPPRPIEPPKRSASLNGYSLPPSKLLTEVRPVDQSSLKNDLKRQAEVLEETLLSFGIEAKVGDIHCGPTVASFEVHPAVGVKVQKIKTLENDIALNMEAKSIRIIAPIPGKAAVGIEIPNPKPQEVSFHELLESYRRGHKKAQIPLLLGKVVNGDDVWADLTKMPHLIIAGATGSGKSVCINTIVMSIVMNSRPDEIKIVMVDPKKVELTAYTHLPHMLAPVITEPGGACAALGWLVKEMERRYEIFRQLGIRNIHGFNTRQINKELEESLELEISDKLSYIVVIIDELADLMMVSSSDIETPIARIAQMARAVGIHMILATQRPSREVITGLIKANFPCRIAFKVSSRVNSQIIIDENGADTLLGNGDMLFLPPGTSSLLRAQGAFIRDEDINNVIHYICSQAPTNYLIPSFDTYRQSMEESGEGDPSSRDPFYEEAKTLVFETGNASTTFLQRKLKIGYARAAGLMDQLEANGVIGPSEGAKPRKIYYPQQESH